MTRRAAFVGPLPPPINGFSNMCGRMLDRLRTRMPVDVFDRAPRVGSPGLTTVVQLLKPLHYLGTCIRRRNAILYLALSGGFGQAIDLLYVLISRLFRRPIFIHHHSFAYINANSFLNRCLFAFVRHETHIVLSSAMGAALKDLYGLDAARVKVVSNAAFYDFVGDEGSVSKDVSAPIQIGFLSNITLEKGIVEFFGILAQLKQGGTEFTARIAGPLAPAAREQFEKLLASSGDVEYVGPIYGSAKDSYYRQLDIFVFPTRYANEAEPLVLYEAMQAGVHAIACDRGAIREMLTNGAGLVFSSDSIVSSAAEHIRKFSRDRTALARAQTLSLQQVQRIRASAVVQLEDLLCCMAGKIRGERGAKLS
jgi:glycosyltransferase involved in cell wall biosynthesis